MSYVSHLVIENNILHSLKRLGTVINYFRPEEKTMYDMNIVFVDASRPNKYGQIGNLKELLIVRLRNGSI